jgi:uncharacterized protein
MPLMIQRIVRGLLPVLDGTRPPPMHDEPLLVRFDVAPGETPSGQPPVRIFLGSERGQFRAERVFLWSIAKHRDPRRVYEVFVMKHLTGFSASFWLTAFTNYRFSIPGFCDYRGRAIYNDVDQVYLTDPAALFDTDMNGAGFLSINDRDTSVMLIDCERMARVWTAANARNLSRQVLEARARNAGTWGELDGAWNARDKEYRADRSKLVHFTTLHTQPWRPFPEHFVYFENPTGSLWNDLEAEADQASFQAYDAARPSPSWRPAIRNIGTASSSGVTLAQALSEDMPLRQLQIDALDRVPDDDLSWVLDRLFARCQTLDIKVDQPLVERAGRFRRALWFWQQQMERAAARHPEVRWRLTYRCGLRRQFIAGGRMPPGPIVALLHRKPGHNHQALALARTLAANTGRELHENTIAFGPVGYVIRRALGAGGVPSLSSDTAAIVAAGWLPTRVARRHRGPRLVLLGRKAGPPPEHGGVLIQCRHFGLPCHPNRITTLLPLNAGVTQQPGAPTNERWREWLAAPHRVAVLVGGTSRSHRLGDTEARSLAVAAASWARARQARLLAITGRRTGSAAQALANALGSGNDIYLWQPNGPDNPYALALAHADALLVTGDSESMLADAVATGRPIAIWPVPAARPNPWQRLCGWVAERASQPRYNRRGSIRPQQGLGYLCARALERGWALPPRDLDALHDALCYRQLAARFGEAEPQPAVPFLELEWVSRQLILRLGLSSETTNEHRSTLTDGTASVIGRPA